jgi:hypothetical protein
MSPKDKDFSVRRSVVSEIRFSNQESLDSIKSKLRRARATGQLTVHVSQGGINTVTFVAKNDLDGHQHIELLFDTPSLT